MSQPPVDPASRDASGDASPTEPVPAFEPALPAAPSTGPTATDLAFTPVEPEPGPGQASVVQPAPAPSGGRSGSSSSKPILIAMGAIVLVGVAAVAFAAGRTSVPASDTAGGVSNRQELQGGGPQGGRQGQGQGRDDQGLGNGGQGQGRGGGRMDQGGQGRGGDGSIPGSGLGRQGMRGLDVSGTVTTVTPDSLTIQTEAGVTVVIGLDDGTTYHQQAPAMSSDVTTGSKVEVRLDGGVRPSRDASGTINLGTAGDVTVVP